MSTNSILLADNLLNDFHFYTKEIPFLLPTLIHVVVEWTTKKMWKIGALFMREKSNLLHLFHKITKDMNDAINQYLKNITWLFYYEIIWLFWNKQYCVKDEIYTKTICYNLRFLLDNGVWTKTQKTFRTCNSLFFVQSEEVFSSHEIVEWLIHRCSSIINSKRES